MLMSNIEEGLQFFDAIKEDHVPRATIIALDYWWFSTTDDHDTVPWHGHGSAVKPTRANVLAPYRWILEGKLTAADFVQIALGFPKSNDLSTEPKLGVQAIKSSNGTRADGTWSLLGTVSTMDFYLNQIVREPKLLLQERAGRYAPDQSLADDKIVQLQDLVHKFEQKGSRVVLLLLPIAPPVVEVMERTGRYKFIRDLRERLTRMGVEYYDFFDPHTVDASVCEFKDPHHGGNALYARMLKTILDRNPSSVLQDFVSYSVVSQVAERFRGRVIATIGSETAAFHELDFLDSGCQK